MFRSHIVKPEISGLYLPSKSNDYLREGCAQQRWRDQMYLFIQILLSAFVGVTLLHSPWASADSRSSDDHSETDNLPLSQEDLRDITAQVMAKQPLLSSSPGIKYAEATRIDRWSEDVADVIYYPHFESAGIKEAFQVGCTRKIPSTAWTCEDATIRRYLALDTQDYEVRVRGTISSDAAIALVEATRKVLPVRAADNSDVPDTAMTLSSYDDSAIVTWVNFEGRSHLIVKGWLAEGGDPTRPEDWIVNRN
jgi:hypothetical protein